MSKARDMITEVTEGKTAKESMAALIGEADKVPMPGPKAISGKWTSAANHMNIYGVPPELQAKLKKAKLIYAKRAIRFEW